MVFRRLSARARLVALLAICIAHGAAAEPIIHWQPSFLGTFSMGPIAEPPPPASDPTTNLGTFSIGRIDGVPLSSVGGDGACGFDVVSGSLPPGLAIRFDGSSFPAGACGLVGVATTPGPYTFQASVTSAGVTTLQNFTMTITDLVVKDLGGLPRAFAWENYSHQLTAIRGDHAVTATWVPEGVLPDGMSLSETGLVLWTPQSPGHYTVSFSVSDDVDTVSARVEVTVNGLDLTTPGEVLPDAIRGSSYTTPALTTTGGSGAYSYTVTGFTAGLTMDPSTGILSGTVDAEPGVYEYTVTATDAADSSRVDTKVFTISVVETEAGSPQITSFTAASTDCTIGVPCQRTFGIERGGSGPFIWSAPDLPPGLGIRSDFENPTAATTRVAVWGTPTVAGPSAITLTVVDATGANTSRTFPIDISVLMATNTLPDGMVDHAYAVPLRIIGGSGGYTATQTQGQLPGGLTLDGSNVTVAGTPRESGDFGMAAAIVDSTNHSLQYWSGLFIAGPPVIAAANDVVAEATSDAGAIVTFQSPSVTSKFDPSPTVTISPASGSQFPLGPTVVDVSATDSLGNVTTTTFTVRVEDTQPPRLSLPAPITIEATTPEGALVDYAVGASDLVDGNVSVSCAPTAKSMFHLGMTTVHCTASDSNGHTASGDFTVKVDDTTPPAFSGIPSDLVVEAAGPVGTAAQWPAFTASDSVDGAVALVCEPSSGSLFPINVTRVSCSATDARGNSASTTFTVTVHDTTAPTLSGMPADVVVEATGPTGARVTWVSPTASDLVDSTVSVACSPASDTLFALGETPVTCEARDAHGNSASAHFKVTVRDKTAPVFSHAPPNIVAEATTAAGVAVTWIAPTATDLVDEAVGVTCTPASNSVFTLGETQVTCSATDAHGNTTSAAFKVGVVDTTGPVLGLPSAITVDATVTDTAVAVWSTPTAADLVDGSLPVTCTPSSGSAFPIGVNTVSCTAADTRGNIGSGTFAVVVRDVRPDFVVSLTPATRTVGQRSVITYSVTVSSLNGFNLPVALTVTGLPAGAVASLSPPVLIGSGVSLLTISIAGSTPTGTQTLSVVAAAGAQLHTATATLTVTTYSITGVVSPAGAGTTITLSGAATATTTTDSAGAFTFTNLSNGSYTVKAQRGTDTIIPASQIVSVSDADVVVNFTIQPVGPKGPWTLTFHDEFDGIVLDRTKWGTTYDGGGRTNNDELEWYIDDDSTHIVSDGTLKLTAYQQTTQPGFPYSSGMISSHVSFSQLYGYFEARMKLPAGRGLWPAFWLLPILPAWPPEIDVMENLGHDCGTVYMSNHWSKQWPDGVGGPRGGYRTVPYMGPNFCSDFHTFGVDWTPTYLDYYVDGVRQLHITDHVPLANPSMTGLYLIANLAVGGSWPGSPNSATPFPSALEIDYIRAWRTFADITPPGIAGVSAVAGSNGTAVVSWTTDEPADSRVDYGTTTALGISVSSATLGTGHNLTLTGLLPATTYYYRVSSTDAAGNTATFSTPTPNTFTTPAPPPPAVPTGPSPATGATDAAPSTTLTWSAAGATSYDVNFGTTNPPPLLAANLSSPSIAPGSLTVATTYFWQVLARNAAGTTAGPVWSFTIAGGSTCPCSIWTTTTTPGPMDPETGALELGVKFQADVSGYITGIRFYKHAKNTGTHVGNLWTAGGTRLGTVTFTNETASGWQTATFATPIAITANTTYVASYHLNVGYYASTESGLTTAVDRGPLHALASGSAGGNGVFAPGRASVFPSSSWNSSNYWVDVIFTTTVP